MGQCPNCHTWDSLSEVAQPLQNRPTRVKPPEIMTFEAIAQEAMNRISTGSRELDRVLGGGLVPGCVLLIGGEPGIGKSTLLLQVADRLARQHRVLYVSGEESLAQIKLRGQRLRLSGRGLSLAAEVQYEAVEAACHAHQTEILVIDSVQSMRCGASNALPGSLSQVRDVATALMGFTKPKGITVLIVGHITKDGLLAGPKTLEHMVDGVFYFEGEKLQHLRLVRAQKNRFGPTGELGIFQMESDGLKEVANPSQVLLQQRPEATPGSVVVPCMEGTRPLLIEIQVLTSRSTYSSPRRLAMGLDNNRLALILAIVEKQAGLRLQDLDVFANVVGGIQAREPAIDLGLALAIYSSFRNLPLANDVAVLGELGLAGEVRSVPQLTQRINECASHGFHSVICPRGPLTQSFQDLQIRQVTHLRNALECAV